MSSPFLRTKNSVEKVLFSEFPGRLRSIVKLLNFFDDCEITTRAPLHHLMDIAGVDSPRTLVVMLARMEKLNAVQSGFYVVDPSSGVEAGPYSSLLDIPVNHEPSEGGVSSPVLLTDIKLFYCPKPNRQNG